MSMKINPISYQKELYCSKNINFKGEGFVEKVNGKTLVHDTSFFREPDTDEFVREYLVNNFLSKNVPINMLVGACSIGNEVYTQAIIYDEYSDKVDILGFDISEEAIKRAKEGKYSVVDAPYGDENCYLFADAFLLYPDAKSQRQQKYKSIFDKYFTTIAQKGTEVDPKTHPLFRYMAALERIYQLNENVAQNCSFRIGDITKLDDLVEDNSIHCLNFKNALYHLVCEDIRKRVLKKNSREIIADIATQAHKKLVKGGLFVIGEEESEQGTPVKEVYEVMMECGFEPINTEYRISKLPSCYLGYLKSHYTNVWRKI